MDIPKDLKELYESTAQWDGVLMCQFAETHGITLPWTMPQDAAVRRYLIERIAVHEEATAAAEDSHERDRQDMGMLIRRLLRRIPELGGAKGTIDNTQLIAQTKDYLVRKGLQGSILREDA